MRYRKLTGVLQRSVGIRIARNNANARWWHDASLAVWDYHHQTGQYRPLAYSPSGRAHHCSMRLSLLHHLSEQLGRNHTGVQGRRSFCAGSPHLNSPWSHNLNCRRPRWQLGGISPDWLIKSLLPTSVRQTTLREEQSLHQG